MGSQISAQKCQLHSFFFFLLPFCLLLRCFLHVSIHTHTLTLRGTSTHTYLAAGSLALEVRAGERLREGEAALQACTIKLRLQQQCMCVRVCDVRPGCLLLCGSHVFLRLVCFCFRCCFSHSSFKWLPPHTPTSLYPLPSSLAPIALHLQVH